MNRKRKFGCGSGVEVPIVVLEVSTLIEREGRTSAAKAGVDGLAKGTDKSVPFPKPFTERLPGELKSIRKRNDSYGD